LKVERDQAISRAEEAEQKVKVFGEQKNSVKRERGSYKTLSELTDKRISMLELMIFKNNLDLPTK